MVSDMADKEVKEVSNTFEVTSLREVRLSKKIIDSFNKLSRFQQEDAIGQMLADKIKYVGDKATLKWIKELSELKNK